MRIPIRLMSGHVCTVPYGTVPVRYYTGTVGTVYRKVKVGVLIWSPEGLKLDRGLYQSNLRPRGLKLALDGNLNFKRRTPNSCQVSGVISVGFVEG